MQQSNRKEKMKKAKTTEYMDKPRKGHKWNKTRRVAVDTYKGAFFNLKEHEINVLLGAR